MLNDVRRKADSPLSDCSECIVALNLRKTEEMAALQIIQDMTIMTYVVSLEWILPIPWEKVWIYT